MTAGGGAQSAQVALAGAKRRNRQAGPCGAREDTHANDGPARALRAPMLLPITLAWILGLLYAGSTGAFAKLALATLALGGASLLVLGGDRLTSRLWAAPLSALAFIAGLSLAPAAGAPVLARGRVDLVATVEAESTKPDRRDVTVLVHSSASGSIAVPTGTRLRLHDTRLRVGTRLRVRGELAPSIATRNPSPHPAWPEARATAGAVPMRDDRTVDALSIGWFDDAIGAARERTRAALFSTLSQRAAGVACALVVGDGAMLESGDADSVRGAGLSHVLAVSGTHIAMVGGGFVFVVERLLRRVRRVLEPARWAAALGIPFALLHAAYAGSVPSGWRAAVTASIAWAAIAAGRRPNALETTAAATLLLALPCPNDATRPGFLLSVLATIAVITAPRPKDDSLKEVIAATWSMSWRCAAATAPVVIYVFGDVPLASLVANLILVPLGSIALLPLSILHTMAALVSEPLATLTGALFEPAAGAFLEGSRVFAAMDDGVALPPLTPVQAFVLTIIAMFVVGRARPPLWLGAMAIMLYASDEIRVRARPGLGKSVEWIQLDVGQGDSAMLTMPNGAHILVDFGPNQPDAGLRTIVPLLRAHRWSEIDLAVLSHRHPDHYGGLASVAEALPIGELWEPGEFGDVVDATHASGTSLRPAPHSERRLGDAGSAIAALARRGTRIRTPQSLCGHPRRFGRATLEVVSPCPGPDENASLNDNSLVLRVTIGRRALLLVGDAERETEGRLIEAHARLRADVLKVGHHGSRTSSTEAFVAMVHPRFAIASAGPGNRYLHPHPETLATFAAAHTRLLRTDRHGGVRVVTDGDSLTVTPFVP